MAINDHNDVPCKDTKVSILRFTLTKDILV